MADLQRPSLRLAVILALAVVGLVETLALLQGLRAQRRLRGRVAEAARAQEMWDRVTWLRTRLVRDVSPELLDPVLVSRPIVLPLV